MNLKRWIRRQFRKKSRIYILPTRMGSYLNGLIVLMFMLAIGYSNNLLLIFSLFLFAFNLLWLVQSHFYLNKLKLSHLEIANGHVGEKLPVKIYWQAAPPAPWKWKLTLESATEQFQFFSKDDHQTHSLGLLTLKHRGEYPWLHLKVSTSRPFGLYRVWIFFKIEAKSFAYPQLVTEQELKLTPSQLEGELPLNQKGDEGFYGLAPYIQDEVRKISWKHYARSGELLIKEGEGLRSQTMDFHLRPPQESDLKETYLSQMATQMVLCHSQKIPFSLVTQKKKFATSDTSAHLKACLEELAVC